GGHDVLDERPAGARQRVDDGVDRRFGTGGGLADSSHHNLRRRHPMCIRKCIHSAPMPGKSRVLLDRPTRRAAILRAAATAFAARGFAATSMDDVAAAAGVTRLIVYRHFASKEALYVAVLEHVYERLGEQLAASEGRGEHAAVRALLAVARDDPGGVTLLLRHAA